MPQKKIKIRIPTVEPWIGKEEERLLLEVIQRGWVTESVMTARFESLIREYTGSPHALAVTNGSCALFMALKAAGVGPGDEVLVPDLTFIATANAVIMAGAKPIFVDVEPDTFGIDPRKAKEKITKRTKAIIPVHLYGFAARMEELIRLARTHHLFIIEDAAQGIGVRYRERHTGTWGDIGVISFFGNKTITTGEGGALLTRSDDLYRKCFRLKNHGRDQRGTFIHQEVGFNFSFTEMQAAVGVAQLGKLKKIIARKKKILEIYKRMLGKVSAVRFFEVPKGVEPVFWFTNILVPDAGALSHFLESKGAKARRFFYPLHLQPCYKNLRQGKFFPVSMDLYEHGLSLPSSVVSPLEDIREVAELIRKYYLR